MLEPMSMQYSHWVSVAAFSSASTFRRSGTLLTRAVASSSMATPNSRRGARAYASNGAIIPSVSRPVSCFTFLRAKRRVSLSRGPSSARERSAIRLISCSFSSSTSPVLGVCECDSQHPAKHDRRDGQREEIKVAVPRGVSSFDVHEVVDAVQCELNRAYRQHRHAP